MSQRNWGKCLGGKRYIPPKKNEFEISIFGPGYGESILLHTGNNEWVIIDSCVNKLSGLPTPIEYLQKLQVDVAKSVKLIVATHTHNDHMKGISKIVELCENSKFCCAAAVTDKEFRSYLTLFGNNSIEDLGCEELYKCLTILAKRKKVPGLALANRNIYKRIISLSGLNVPIDIHTLSPSDGACHLSKKAISVLIDEVSQNKNKRRNVGLTQNYLCIVLWVEVGEYSFLLGADLENTGCNDIGWKAIVQSNEKPDGKAVFYKISHHGSKSGDDEDIWTKLLHQNPLSALTPFYWGRHKLPTEEDIKRITLHTKNAFSSSIFKQKKVRRDSAIEKTINETVKEFGMIQTSPGQIRIRYTPSNGEKPTADIVELFDGAVAIDEMYDSMRECIILCVN